MDTWYCVQCGGSTRFGPLCLTGSGEDSRGIILRNLSVVRRHYPFGKLGKILCVVDHFL